MTCPICCANKETTAAKLPIFSDLFRNLSMADYIQSSSIWLGGYIVPCVLAVLEGLKSLRDAPAEAWQSPLFYMAYFTVCIVFIPGLITLPINLEMETLERENAKVCRPLHGDLT